jgi:copper(I)-binding protein
MTLSRTTIIASLLACSFSAFAAVTEQVQVTDGFVRAVPPGQQVSAAFMTIHNDDMNDHKVVSASSPAAKNVELHTHTHDNGVMKMRQIPEINLPAGGDAILKPGGLHVMLIGLTQELTADKPVAVTIKFEDGSEKALSLPVKGMMPSAMTAH